MEFEPKKEDVKKRVNNTKRRLKQRTEFNKLKQELELLKELVKEKSS